MRNITGYTTIFCSLKHTGNKEGIGLINMNDDIRDVDHLKSILRGIDPNLEKYMTEKSL